MIIALDYDGTYSVDPSLFDEFIAAATKRGHQVWCVTMRYPHEPLEMPCPVVYTSRAAKAPFMARNGGVVPDVWIDDAPHWIFQSST